SPQPYAQQCGPYESEGTRLGDGADDQESARVPTVEIGRDGLVEVAMSLGTSIARDVRGVSEEDGSRRAPAGPIPDQVRCRERKTSPGPCAVLTRVGMKRIGIAHIQVVDTCHAAYL